MWYMTEEREMLQKMMQEFVKNDVKPFVHKMETEDTHPTEILKKLGQMGVLGLTADEKFGGVGVDWVSFGIALEEISKESNVLGLLTALASDWIPTALSLDCTEEQIEKYVKPALRGEILLGGYCTEPCGLTNFPEYETKAVLDGDEWVLNGTKILGTNNGVADAFFVVCRTDNYDPATATGVSMFILPADTPGVKFGHNEHKLGWKGSATGTLYLDNVRLPKDSLVGKLNYAAHSNYFRDQTQGLCEYGPMSLGSAESVWMRTRKFLSERIQNGKSLWDAHQHIRITMAEMWMEIENYRCAVYSVLENRNRGEDVFNHAVALKTAGAKLLESVASKCITLHGGTGTVFETDIERFYRDAPMNTVGCGSIMTFADQISYTI